MTKIENKAQYDWAVSRVEELLPMVNENTPLDDPHNIELTLLSNLVSDYSDTYYAIGKPTHPGEILKDELAARGITQKRFATTLGVPYTALNEILNGKRPVSIDLALMLEASLGVKAYFWISLQSDYDLQTARKDERNISRLDNLRKVCASLL